MAIKTYGFDEINEIYQELQMGMLCFFHKPSKRIYTFIDWDKTDFGIDDELNWSTTEQGKLDVIENYEIMENIQNGDPDYLQIEAPTSFEKFEVMESFVLNINDKNPLKQPLIFALQNKKPFANFNNIIHNTDDLRQEWFDYNNSFFMNYVKKIVHFYISENGVDEDNDL